MKGLMRRQELINSVERVKLTLEQVIKAQKREEVQIYSFFALGTR